MSERDVRNCLEWGRTLEAGFQRDKTLVRHREKAQWGVACVKALLAKPDAVEFMQYLRDWQEAEDSVLTIDDKILIGVICNDIEREFHVRLIDTEPGWEWIE